MQATCHIRAVEQHGRKLQDLEVLVLVANAILSVEDVMLARALENDHHRHQQGREDDDCNAREKDVEETLEECVHSF